MTIGLKSASDVHMGDLVHMLNAQGIYVADITKGKLHWKDLNTARVGFFVQQAWYYSVSGEPFPTGFSLQLTQTEWDVLPISVHDFYAQHGGVTIINR
jgi:hypothetical protein